MTDAQKYAKVFRAAADGAEQEARRDAYASPISLGKSRDEIERGLVVASVFAAIAEVFEKIAEAEAEALPRRAQGDPGYLPCPILGPGGWCRVGGCACSERDPEYRP